jgi:nucleoside-diphosphate-sugar epimerase
MRGSQVHEQPPRILVTGAPGWLGTALVHALAEGGTFGPVTQKPESVQVLASPRADVGALRALAGVRVTQVDLRAPVLPQFLAGVDTVVHAAGVIHPKKTEEFQTVNIDGTRHMLQAAMAAGVRRFIYISSNSAAGLNPHPDVLMREDDPAHPYLGYGRSKAAAEHLVRVAQGQMETVILRPCWFYGPYQPLRQTTFFQMVAKGRPPVFGDGKNLRSMTYVDNLIQGVLLARDKPQASGRTYWIADAEPYAWREILATVAKLLDAPLRPQHVPALTSNLARIADMCIQRAGLYQQEVHVVGELGATIAVSIARAQHELGYAPQIALEEGMRRSIAWCRAQGVKI